MIALVWGGTLNSSAANLRTAVKGAASGTLNLRERERERELIYEGDGEWEWTKKLFDLNEHFEGKLWIGGESHFEGDLSTTTTTRHCFSSAFFFLLSAAKFWCNCFYTHYYYYYFEFFFFGERGGGGCVILFPLINQYHIIEEKWVFARVKIQAIYSCFKTT